ncbi:MAG: Nucleoid occlusion factor SlmA [Nitrospirae bacterium]|nr:MAG: Nucleoid occlusion factor SlmA [Nitrospira sp. OLB3]MBV6471235.1 Nucleoid occlusion factor SlmA [Nitrospirota bacterium]MCE7966304.1 TetR/AcrR family transcriptional regulator [Nitrospira sp. NTP2]MCK6491961.1 TetR/AcrR family transcriptional regulator [Nitrospira sp.]MEB2339735.1 TetR/AcrR family transcriptional regulator [Nitrospirales bacterium]
MPSHPKHLPADQRRISAVQAVIALAAVRNPTEITTAAVAKRMGLTQGALFRHFPSKDAILEAVMKWVADRLLARIDAAAQAASSPLSALEAVFFTHIDFVVEHPGVPRMLIGELQRSEDTVTKRMVRTLLRAYTERLIRLMEEGKQQGQLDPHLDTAAAATLFVGTIQGLVLQSLLTGNVPHIRRQAPDAFTIYRRGIVSRGQPSGANASLGENNHPA